MLRLKQSLGSTTLCVRGVKTWHKELEAPLKRVGARIDAALQVGGSCRRCHLQKLWATGHPLAGTGGVAPKIS